MPTSTKSVPRFRSAWGLTSGFMLVAVSACETPSYSAPNVTRSHLGDTLVVTTDPGPDPGRPVYHVELDLTIGELDGPEEYVLSPSSVSADGEGRIYVSDERRGEIRIFEAHGQYLRSFGRRGDGPGEFNSTSRGFFSVRSVAGNRITVEDLPRLRVFEENGSYLSSFDLVFAGGEGERRFARSRWISWLPERGLIVAHWFPTLPDGSRGESLVLLDDSLEVIREFPAVEVGSNGGDEWGLSPFPPEYEWALSGNRILAWGGGDEYRIDMFDLETDSWIRAAFLLPPNSVTRMEIQAFKDEFLAQNWVKGQEGVWEPRLNRAVYPEKKPYFTDLLGDEEGRVWVQRYSPVSGPNGEEWVRYDLFDGEGQWLGIVDSPGAFEYVRDGFGYRINYDVYPRVERYRLVEGGSTGVG